MGKGCDDRKRKSSSTRTSNSQSKSSKRISNGRINISEKTAQVFGKMLLDWTEDGKGPTAKEFANVVRNELENPGLKLEQEEKKIFKKTCSNIERSGENFQTWFSWLDQILREKFWDTNKEKSDDEKKHIQKLVGKFILLEFSQEENKQPPTNSNDKEAKKRRLKQLKIKEAKKQKLIKEFREMQHSELIDSSTELL